ncbi:MAG: DUF6056 family protein [Lachnospiraceae bacterium]|nr:DUF6056 family protein [Lachnospiraceae bacterium]MDD7628450.1 DUF6056 family protein [Lachnospiraceae bacterium]MDY4119976.1 DUF6056 family protein [Lachnospiraceae bacterium]
MVDKKKSRWITPKRLAVFLTIIYIISLIPLLWIGHYNYPSADDYSNGSNCRQTFVETKSVFMVIGTAVKKAVGEWHTWRGCFTSSFLSSIMPNVFGEGLYQYTTWVVLTLFSLSCLYLLNNIFVKVFHSDKWRSLCVTMIMLFASVHCMVGRVEILYWYSGAINYLFTYAMSLFFFGLLISCCFSKGKKHVFELVMASFLGFSIGGGNQVTILNVAIILFLVIAVISYSKMWKKNWSLMIPIGLFYIGFILNVMAPGNRVRADGASGMNPIKAVFVSFYYCLEYVIGEWTTWPIIIMVILMIPLFWGMVSKTKFEFPCPLIVVILGYCIVSAMITPPLFAVGNFEAGRLQAMVYLMYLLVMTLCVGYITGWVRRKVDIAGEWREKEERNFSMNETLCILCCLLLFAFGAVITIIPDPHYFTFSSAMTDLADGSAKAYGDAMKERIVLYHSGEKDIVVEPLPVQPALLYFSDIKEDPEDWENRGLCRFYGIDSVRVERK